MFSRSSVDHERGQEFEQWQQWTAEALERPGVQQQLGALGAQLIALNKDAFPLNVRWGKVSVPVEYQDTDRIGILPYLASDRGLRPHDTLLRPPPARRELMRAHLGQAGLGNTDRDVDTVIQRYLRQIEAKERKRLVYPNPRGSARGGALTHCEKRTGTLVASRSVVIARCQGVPMHKALRGADGAHELVHVVDVQGLVSEPDDLLYHGRTELRGYRVGAIAAEGAIAAGVLSRSDYETHEEHTLEVEGVRQKYHIDSNELLNGTVSDKQIDGASFDMLFMSYFG